MSSYRTQILKIEHYHPPQIVGQNQFIMYYYALCNTN